jgi:hypothetical protein
MVSHGRPTRARQRRQKQQTKKDHHTMTFIAQQHKPSTFPKRDMMMELAMEQINDENHKALERMGEKLKAQREAMAKKCKCGHERWIHDWEHWHSQCNVAGCACQAFDESIEIKS